MGFGDYPPEYNRNIHGPYDPARYYGKPDTPFGDVKLIELPSWLGRRSMNPANWAAAVSRAYWRWHHNWMFPKKAGAAGLHQIVFTSVAFFYIINYRKHWDEMRCKYH